MTSSTRPSAIVRKETARRAKSAMEQAGVAVHYYRIRQRHYFPMPVEEFPAQLAEVRGLPDYPFAIWMLWALEDRILALGWHAEWNEDSAAARLCQRDMEGLCRWTRFRQLERPDLCVAHLTRLYLQTLRWRWVSGELRNQVTSALHRLVEDGMPHAPEVSLPLDAPLEDVVAGFSNITVIGRLSLARAALGSDHPRKEPLIQQALHFADHWLALGERGQSEGICYDGYTADFLLDLLADLPEAGREPFLKRPRLKQTLEMLQCLGAPGQSENFALIGDVEPMEMPFVYSFAVKLAALNGEPVGVNPPSRGLSHLRSDALPHVPTRWRERRSPVSQSRWSDAHYALAMDTGSAADTLRTVISWSHSRMGHMQRDHGSVVVGREGLWLIDDPGYRQYLPTAEKEFTIGSRAHNQPIINGFAPTRVLPNRMFETLSNSEGTGVRLDLTPIYPEELALRSVIRSVICHDGRIRVIDEIEAPGIDSLEWVWHGHPSAAWRVADGRAWIMEGSGGIVLSCSSLKLATGHLQRLPGSRGHLSMVARQEFDRSRHSVRVEWSIGPAGSGR